MSRRKKKKRHFQGKNISRQEPEIFNPAFEDLGTLNKKDEKIYKTHKREQADVHEGRQNEDLYFLEAMSGVEPLPGNKKKVTRIPTPDIRPAHPVRDGEVEAMAHLSHLVKGLAEMDITFSDEYVEGSVHGFDRSLMKKLKKGKFPIQDYTDLHGLTKKEAEIKVRDFLLASHQLGLRCVLIVHGRGLNSENHIPVLKERLPVWLNRGPIRKIVLAFSTAMPYDGGTGAIYILLKRRKGSP